ncbi:sulfatase-like hydrolase/transferase [Phaeodactylibacter xiamenensis]|uniref:sulfatase-like hydrolase/transferase n=1 Tax=Phaeodactylibacter xiamenensis TaxID=1524460 RepID=UPI003CCC09E1
MKYFTILLFALAFTLGCNDEPEAPTPTATAQPNILLILADDMGKDATSGFTEGNTKPGTPNLDRLRTEGLTFNRLWVNPTCSPTRASILTGRYGYRTGVKWAGDPLPITEKSLHQYIKDGTDGAYATALIGKWHLSEEGAVATPESFGIDYYAGLARGAVQNYYQWQLTEDGSGSLQTEYITQVFTDLSIDWVNSQSRPWFLWLAYNAPHTPFHTPPAAMHTQGALPDYADGLDPTPYYMAAIEAMDFQIGRLLEGIPTEVLDNTLIIFLADNGTPAQVAQAPYSGSTVKGSLYQGGVNVPMFVSGKGVTRQGEDNSLLCSTDLFSTIANLTGINEAVYQDSYSFANLLTGGQGSRTFQYAEMDNGTTNAWAISNGKYKLITGADGNEELYQLEQDPYENNNLLLDVLPAEAAEAKSVLEAALSAIRN